MSVIHNFFFFKFLQTIYFDKAESARKIDGTTTFSIYRMSHMIFRVEKLILDKKVEKLIGPLYFTVKLSVYRTTSDMFRTIWTLKARELTMNNCFAIQRYRALNIIILFHQDLIIFNSHFAI